MVFGFCKRSKGYIKVYSEIGIGTTFRLYLPREQDQEQKTITNNQYPITLPRGHETILIVDDEEDLLDFIKDSLEALGYQIVTANNGEQALEQLDKKLDIDLLFSDVVMPGNINGYELAEQAKEKYTHLKVLLASGFTNKAIAHNAQAGFDANLLGKPYTHTELAKRIRALLDG